MTIAPAPRSCTTWLENRRAASRRLAPFTDCGRVDPWTSRPRPVLAAASLAAAAGILPPEALALAGLDALRAAWPHCADDYERTRLAAAARIAQAAQAAPTITPGSSRWPGPNLPTTGGPSL